MIFLGRFHIFASIFKKGLEITKNEAQIPNCQVITILE
ncbi:MAG: hypothetical protein ACI8YQ_003739 [Polaribacter sp.]|jgi:hypothetical protein